MCLADPRWESPLLFNLGNLQDTVALHPVAEHTVHVSSYAHMYAAPPQCSVTQDARNHQQWPLVAMVRRRRRRRRHRECRAGASRALSLSVSLYSLDLSLPLDGVVWSYFVPATAYNAGVDRHFQSTRLLRVPASVGCSPLSASDSLRSGNLGLSRYVSLPIPVRTSQTAGNGPGIQS